MTAAGERLRVVYRGRRTGGPGPDFRDALIAAPGGLLRGDVELHVRSSDFRRHGHHLDAAYAGVVLHLVFRDDGDGVTLLPGGGQARVVALERWVEGRAQEIRGWLERPALWREPCLSAVARGGAPAVASTLERLGDMRFRAKAALFAQRLAGEEADELLWQGLLAALGYGSAPEALSALAQRARWAPLQADLRTLAPSERAVAAYRWLAGAGLDWAVAGRRPLRPANWPENRLRGAAALAARFTEKGLRDSFAAAVDGDAPAGQRDGANVESATKGKYGEDHGLRSLALPTADRSAPPVRRAAEVAHMISMLTVPGLVGRSRAIEMIANAVLPCLAAIGPEARARRAEAAYHRLPLPARYGGVRHLHEAVGDSVRVDFRRQQGMLYLLKQYCTQGGCGRCPLS